FLPFLVKPAAPPQPELGPAGEILRATPSRTDQLLSPSSRAPPQLVPAQHLAPSSSFRRAHPARRSPSTEPASQQLRSHLLHAQPNRDQLLHAQPKPADPQSSSAPSEIATLARVFRRLSAPQSKLARPHTSSPFPREPIPPSRPTSASSRPASVQLAAPPSQARFRRVHAGNRELFCSRERTSFRPDP
ncbi:Unknown protein, partial [Striga hermonthica]